MTKLQNSPSNYSSKF